MFIQVIEGKVRDQEALQRQIDQWQRDLMPGAIGYLDYGSDLTLATGESLTIDADGTTGILQLTEV